ncbi:hypothetical protein Ato02nite_092100 [Paractinoplanes toevensis]|uniref:Uncharacterized protein n=1 Tax=Paractinoplanes toevensis TaxID=571911 RepID=A0A919WBX8_9ACTN|nr:hypothetical protein Ato02nite_092100 [Actinoplanes toevensis]
MVRPEPAVWQPGGRRGRARPAAARGGWVSLSGTECHGTRPAAYGKRSVRDRPGATYAGRFPVGMVMGV